jgi:hypothetical protein
VRTFAGALLVSGLLCSLYNMWMTALHDEPYDEREMLLPVAD